MNEGAPPIMDSEMVEEYQPFQPGLNFRVDPPLEGEENMEIDRVWLEWVETTTKPVTVIRFYRWKKPTISIGQHQEKELAVDDHYCRRQSIEVVRRPTGGRAVLHDDELTYAVISNQLEQLGTNISRAYLKIAEALLKGLRLAGLDVELVRGVRAGRLPFHHPQSACFVSASRYEISWRGRKIVGSAQRRMRRSFLQHGSIPLSIQYDVMARCFGNKESCLRRSMVSISEALSRPASFEFLQFHLQQGFRQILGSPVPFEE